MVKKGELPVKVVQERAKREKLLVNNLLERNKEELEGLDKAKVGPMKLNPMPMTLGRFLQNSLNSLT